VRTVEGDWLLEMAMYILAKGEHGITRLTHTKKQWGICSREAFFRKKYLGTAGNNNYTKEKGAVTVLLLLNVSLLVLEGKRKREK